MSPGVYHNMLHGFAMAENTVPERRERAARRFGVHAVLAFIAVLLLALPFAGLVFLIVSKSAPLTLVDRDTANSLHSYAVGHPAFTASMRTISAIVSPLGWWIVLTPVFVWLLLSRRPRLAAFLAITALGSSLLNTLIKWAVDRARPHLADPVAVAAGRSFPSGHTQAATVGFGIIVLIFLPVISRRARTWVIAAAGLAVALVAFSRIALGVHYLSDVVGALVIGTAWLLAMSTAFSAWRRDLNRLSVPQDPELEPANPE